MQPDLPEPVVPAIRMCGIRARSAQTALPEMSLPSQTASGLALDGQVVVDVAERDDLRREVRHLDADRLLAGDRRQDPDLGRRERVGEVVLERRDLRDLRPGRELELVAGHARAGDLADDRRLDAEVRERGHERVGRPLVGPLRAGRRGRRVFEDGAVGQHVLALGARGVEERRSAPRSPSSGVDEQRRRLGQALGDDVGVVVHDVDRRLVVREHGRRCGDVLTLRPLAAGRPARRTA